MNKALTLLEIKTDLLKVLIDTNSFQETVSDYSPAYDKLEEILEHLRSADDAFDALIRQYMDGDYDHY